MAEHTPTVAWIEEVQHADLRLMIAAPDLLAALTAQRCFDCQQWLEITERRSPRKPCTTCAPAMAAMALALGRAVS